MKTTSARLLKEEIGYAKWENFCCIIKKAIQICPKEVKQVTIKAKIGSGAKRDIVDYNLTDRGVELIKKLSNKATPLDYFKINEEGYIVALLDKYFKTKNINIIHQFRIHKYIYDCKISNVLLEIDGHYHLSAKQKIVDKKKDKIAIENGYNIVRITYNNDIIDIILKIENIINPVLFSKERIRQAGIECELNSLDIEHLIENL